MSEPGDFDITSKQMVDIFLSIAKDPIGVMAQLVDDAAEIRKQLSESDFFVNGLRGQCVKLKAENAHLTAELAAERAKCNELEAVDEIIATINKQNAGYIRQIRELTQQNAHLSSMLDESSKNGWQVLKDATAKVKQLTAALAAERERNKGLAEALKSAKAIHDQRAKDHSECGDPSMTYSFMTQEEAIEKVWESLRPFGGGEQ